MERPEGEASLKDQTYVAALGGDKDLAERPEQAWYLCDDDVYVSLSTTMRHTM
jgi:hypothetical protein